MRRALLRPAASNAPGMPDLCHDAVGATRCQTDQMLPQGRQPIPAREQPVAHCSRGPSPGRCCPLLAAHVCRGGIRGLACGRPGSYSREESENTFQRVAIGEHMPTMTVSGRQYNLEPRPVEAALQEALPEPIHEPFVG